MKTKILTASVALALSSLPMAATADMVIDLFNTSGSTQVQDMVDDGVVAASSTTGPVAEIVGGVREYSVEDITLSDPANPLPESANAGTRLNFDFGTLNWSVDSTASGEAVVRWDGVDNTIATGIGEDFALGLDLSGDVNLAFDVVESDLNFTFEIGLFTSSTVFTNLIFQSSGAAGIVTFPLLAWSDPFTASGGLTPCGFINPGPPGADTLRAVECGAGNATVDLADVNAIEIRLTSLLGNGTVDLRLESFTTVPAPGALALLGIGLAAAGAAGRKRKVAFAA